MTNEQFHTEINNAVKQPTLARAVSDVKSAIYEHTQTVCANPRLLTVTSSDLGYSYTLPVRCGKCDNCRDTQRNEWVTRMYLETKYNSKYCYMVTLHYRGFEHGADIPDELRSAYYHYDDMNSTHHFCWHPCLVRLEHLQMFMRHLRHDTKLRNPDIRYFASGEVGKTYGRPHFHLIIWSKDKLYASDIQKAWSVRVGRKNPKYISIGNFDFADLAENGTLVPKGANIDGAHRSAKYCFKYVCKYLQKSTEANYCRYRLFAKDLLDSNPVPSFLTVDGWRSQSSSIYDKNFFAVFNDYRKLCNKLITKEAYDYFIQNGIDVRKILYDAIMEYLSKSVDNCVSSLAVLFPCIVTMSRGSGIGELYAKDNIDRFLAGNTGLEKAPFGRLVFPRYFIRKIKEHLHPVERHSQCADSLSFSKSNRPLLLHDLEELSNRDFWDFNDKGFVSHINPFECGKQQLAELLNGVYSFRDAVTHERMLIYSRVPELADSVLFCVGFWLYDRSAREYVFKREMPLQQFVDLFRFYSTRSADYTRPLVEKSIRDNELVKSAIELCDCLLQEDSDFTLHGGVVSQDVTYRSLRASALDYFALQRQQHAERKYHNYSSQIF